LALSASVVFVVLTILAAAFRQREHDRAIDVILDGYEEIPIAAVRRQRRRLLSDRTRRTLARNFEHMIHQASAPQIQMRGARPLFHLRVVAKVSPDLYEVVRLLRTGHVPARGVARAERMITDGTSPLYGLEVDALREELHRVRRMLGRVARRTGKPAIGADR
jgi:hypothetical protein